MPNEERRHRKRQQLQYACSLLVGEDRIRGMLMDVSATGARVSVPDPKSVPDRVVLVLAGAGRVARSCRVMWRDERFVGLRYIKDETAQTRG